MPGGWRPMAADGRAMPNGGLTTEQRRALQVLAGAPNGCTEPALRGFIWCGAILDHRSRTGGAGLSPGASGRAKGCPNCSGARMTSGKMESTSADHRPYRPRLMCNGSRRTTSTQISAAC
jgi:hypothetical protein